MKKRSFLTLSTFVGLFAMYFFTGCGEDEVVVTGDAKFSYEVDGYSVTFTNESDVTPPVTYSWAFGDDNTSQEENPVHIYESSGDYTATLTVTDQFDETHVYSEDIEVVRNTGLTFGDGSLDDWKNVTEERLIGSTSLDVNTFKVQYDANFLYIYAEWTGTYNEDNKYNCILLFDFDNSVSTGYYKPDHWNDFGAEMLIQFNTIGDYSIGINQYTGEDGSDKWSWAGMTLADGAVTMGTIAQLGSSVGLEMRFDRSKVFIDGSHSFANDDIALGLLVLSPAWALVGYGPEQGGKLLLLDMTK